MHTMPRRQIAQILMLKPPTRGWWTSVDPSAPGASAGSLAAWIGASCAALALFLWFGGLIRIQSAGGERLYLSGIPTARVVAADGDVGIGSGHQVASMPGGMLMVGPYRTAPLNIARCLAAAASVGIGVILMRAIALRAAWPSHLRDDERSRRIEAASTVTCARIAAAHVLAWIAISTLAFAAAALVPPGALTLAVWASRAALAVMAFLWQPLLLWITLGPAASDGLMPSRTLCTALHAVLNALGLLLAVWGGAAAVA